MISVKRSKSFRGICDACEEPRLRDVIEMQIDEWYHRLICPDCALLLAERLNIEVKTKEEE